MKKEIIVDGIVIPMWIYNTRPKAFDLWSKQKKAEYIQIRKHKNLQNVNKYAKENPEKYKAAHKRNNDKYFIKNAQKIREKKRIAAYNHYHKNIEKMRERARLAMLARRNSDPAFKIKQNISRRIRHLLVRAKTIKKDSSLYFVGCSTKELKDYIEKLMTSKMNWDNYGKTWEIDHIMPCSSFDHTDIEQVKRCWHYSNLRPISIFANRSKHAKITDPQYKLRLPIN